MVSGARTRSSANLYDATATNCQPRACIVARTRRRAGRDGGRFGHLDRNATSRHLYIVAMCEAEEETILRDALQTLPEDQRIVLEAWYFEDISFDELVLRTGVPRNTLRARVSRARSRLREALARDPRWIALEEIRTTEMHAALARHPLRTALRRLRRRRGGGDGSNGSPAPLTVAAPVRRRSD